MTPEPIIAKPASKDPLTFKLNFYYYALVIVGIIIPLVVAVLVIFYPAYFAWFGQYQHQAIVSLFIIGIVQAILFGINEIFHKNLFFTLARYAYVIFFLYFIFITGGINSSFIFILFFPVIATAVYLDRTTTRNIGIVVSLGLAGMIIFLPTSAIDAAVLTKHIIQVVLLGTLSYLTYTVVIETLHEKYQNEETTKRLGDMLQIDRLKGDFLSVAQHQLRTPLSGVKWALEMLKSEPSMTSDAMSLIEAGLERVKDSITIINKMLKTIDASGENLTLKPESVDVVGVVKGIIAELNFIILKKGIKLVLLSPQSLMIQADKDKFKAALINIVDNAIKYSPQGKVEINIEDGPVFVKITVTDTGIGIAPADTPFIFDRLHRGKNAIMLEPDESGVGLYTSKKMIELHGGKISIESELNKGTTVKVELPKS